LPCAGSIILFFHERFYCQKNAGISFGDVAEAKPDESAVVTTAVEPGSPVTYLSRVALQFSFLGWSNRVAGQVP
jgi:hypothetical protein